MGQSTSRHLATRQGQMQRRTAFSTLRASPAPCPLRAGLTAAPGGVSTTSSHSRAPPPPSPAQRRCQRPRPRRSRSTCPLEGSARAPRALRASAGHTSKEHWQTSRRRRMISLSTGPRRDRCAVASQPQRLRLCPASGTAQARLGACYPRSPCSASPLQILLTSRPTTSPDRPQAAPSGPCSRPPPCWPCHLHAAAPAPARRFPGAAGGSPPCSSPASSPLRRPSASPPPSTPQASTMGTTQPSAPPSPTS